MLPREPVGTQRGNATMGRRGLLRPRSTHLKPIFHLAVFAVYFYELWYDVTVTSPVFLRSKFMDPRINAIFQGSAWYKSMFLTSWCSVREVGIVYPCKA